MRFTVFFVNIVQKITTYPHHRDLKEMILLMVVVFITFKGNNLTSLFIQRDMDSLARTVPGTAMVKRYRLSPHKDVTRCILETDAVTDLYILLSVNTSK